MAVIVVGQEKWFGGTLAGADAQRSGVLVIGRKTHLEA